MKAFASACRNAARVAAAVTAAAAFAAPVAAQQLNVICPVQAEWCNARRDRIREGDRNQGRDDAQGLGRVVRADRRRKGQSEARRLVRRHRRPASAGRRAGPARGIQVADARAAAAVGAEAGGAIEVPHGRACTSACSASATTPSSSRRRSSPRPRAGRTSIKPEFAGEVQMANPNASGTAYTAIATLVQVIGEEEAFKYLKALHKNINNYPRSGVRRRSRRPRAARRWRASRSSTTSSPRRRPASRSKAVAPCEGTGYEIGSLSIVKGARNLDNAKKFYDWALTPKAQALGGAGEAIPDPVERRHADVAAVAEGRRHQAHQLRLREVRLSRPSASACSSAGTRKSARIAK